MSLFTKNCLRIGGIVLILGFILIGVSFAFGFSWHGVKLKDYNFDYSSEYNQEIHDIEIKLSVANVTVKRGDTFSIDAKNMNKDSFESFVEDGVWKIRDKEKRSKIFGISIPYFGDDDDYKYKTDITIPEDFNPEKLKINLGAGQITLCNIEANTIDFNLGAGKLTSKRLTVKNDSKIKVGAGEADITRLEAKNIDLDCGAGEMRIAGDITGDSSIRCGVGHIKLELEQEESQYYYNVKCGIGNVEINDDSYYFTDHGRHGNSNAENTFTVDCGIGKIEVLN